MAQLERFHLIAIGVASLILVVALVLIGVLLINGNKSYSFPPLANTCPDFWYQSSNICQFPTVGRKNSIKDMNSLKSSNTPGLQTDNKGTKLGIDFTHAGWSSYGGKTDPACAKKLWCNQHSIYWDGITNYNKCP